MPRRVNAASTRRHLGVSPLLSPYLKVDDDPKRMATCATSDAATVFEVPASLFANIAPSPCSYSLLNSVSSLECRELILNSEFRPVPAPVLRAFLADVGIADIDAGFYFRLLL